MKTYHTLWSTTVLVFLCFYTAQIWSAYLPIVEEHNLNNLEGTEKQTYQRRSFTQSPEYRRSSTSEEAGAEDNYNDPDAVVASNTDTDTSTNEQTSAMLPKWRLLPHGSYDKNYDVVPGKAPVDAVAWSFDQSNSFHAYENSYAYDAFEGDSDIEADGDGDGDGDGEDELIAEEKTNAEILSRKRRGFDDWFIAPHTRWCGRGNSANNTYNQLGGASDADRCCRRHDHCPLFISAFSSRYEYFNFRPYTLSHCSCDRSFRTCLKMNNDDASTTIGQLFFNMVPSQCFIVRKERQCQQRDEEGNCVKETTRKRAFVRDNLKY
ncbi:PREDICTED: uncharacterized protein LOC108380788 [Rhagoletis zephyria]|uniref:uncharacterized protein LOC108380788 n=1 Tax=Rhagoletis zephyria TaxID=28612 RepID=UPI0008119E12|nr:PREDICTED: uncharacterized protein LOC108380788 [Rhagoletis zephyria]